MASLPPEEQVRFLLACLKNTEPPDFAAVAIDSGLTNRKNARSRYKSLVEAHNYVMNGENKIEVKAGAANFATPVTPKTTAAGAITNSDEATPAETSSTSSPKKRGRPKKNAGDGDQTETPAKKPRKPRAKKEKQNNNTEGADEVIAAHVDVSNVGHDSNGKVDDIEAHSNGNIDED